MLSPFVLPTRPVGGKATRRVELASFVFGELLLQAERRSLQVMLPTVAQKMKHILGMQPKLRASQTGKKAR